MCAFANPVEPSGLIRQSVRFIMHDLTWGRLRSNISAMVIGKVEC